jgi:hypothetical protein
MNLMDGCEQATQESPRQARFLLATFRLLSIKNLLAGRPSTPMTDSSKQGHSVLHGPRIKIADTTHAPNSLGAIVLPT